MRDIKYQLKNHMPMWLKLRDSLFHKAAIPRWLVAKTDLPMPLEPTQGSAKRGLTRSTRHAVEEESQRHLNPERNRCCSILTALEGLVLFLGAYPALTAWKAEALSGQQMSRGFCAVTTGLDMQ